MWGEPVPHPDFPIVPRALVPGDRVRVVAPSGAFDRALFWRGLGFLAGRYRVEFDRSLFERHQGYAGADERRRAELAQALTDPGVAAVIAARGGYGLTRILPQLPLAALVTAPRWIVGFSDITALHVEAMRRGVASLHAANVTGLGRGDAVARAEFIAALEHPGARREVAGLTPWVGGCAAGPLVGGNLTLLFTCAAAGRLTLPPGVVLVLEDVTELSYRIDRMLTALLDAGVFERVAAIIVGELLDCPAGSFGVSAAEVVRERLARLGVPLVAGFPCGHGSDNLPLPLGRRVLVDATRGVVVLNAEASP